MGIIDNLLDRISNTIADRLLTDDGRVVAAARNYREGHQPRQLKVRFGQYDDNLTVNFVGVVVDRAVSQMIGDGFTLDFYGDAETENERYVNAVLDANGKEILFHRTTLAASEAGTGYLQILPDGQVGKDGILYPRLQLIDPAFVTMETLPEDFEIVYKYTIQYKFTDYDGESKSRKREIVRDLEQAEAWTVTDYIADQSGRWTMVGATVWAYSFPPILHWQNLPRIDGPYGEPDITDDVKELQDRINLVGSNISKLIRLYAHPLRYALNVDVKDSVDVGPDKMLKVSSTTDGGQIVQLEPLGDLAASMAFLRTLRQSLFDTTRTVDLDSMQDKLGSLTNFGLKVLYQDNASKINTKRALFGEALIELARRLQILKGMQPINCEVIWPDIVPQNPMEDAQRYQLELNMGVVDQQTVSGNLGYDWELIKERKAEEQTDGDNVGAAILRAFDRGQNTGLEGV